jgi:hypothetical protein
MTSILNYAVAAIIVCGAYVSLYFVGRLFEKLDDEREK